MIFNLPIAHSLHLSSSSSLMSHFSIFVFYYPVSVTLHSGCHALIRDRSHTSLLPLSHCLCILVYSSFHILSIWASFSSLLTLVHLFMPSSFRKHLSVFLKTLSVISDTFQAFCFIYVSLFVFLLLHVISFSTLLWLFVLLYFSCFPLPLFPLSSVHLCC